MCSLLFIIFDVVQRANYIIILVYYTEPKLYVNTRKYSLNYEKIMKTGPMNFYNDLGHRTIIRIHCKNAYTVI